MNTSNGREWKWLYHYPKRSYKQLSIKGTKIHARTIYGQSIGEDARTPEQLAEDFGVPPEAVLEAIEYCESDPPEIREDWEMEERSIREAEERNVPGFRGPKWHADRQRELRQKSAEG